MKLSNTQKHLSGGFLAGFITMIIMLNLPNPKHFCWLAIIGWAAITIGWEYYQFLKYGSKPNYWHYRKLDTIMDLLAGNLPFILMTLAGTFGI